MNVKSAGKLISHAASDFSDDNVLTMGAALSYYAMFSIGPLLAISVALAGAIFGADTVRHHVHDSLQGILGVNSAKTVDSMMAAPQPVTSTIMKVIGLASLLFGSTSVFSQLQTSLNTIWGVKSKPGRGIFTFIRNRILSFGMVLCIGFLLLMSLALSTAVAAFTASLDTALHAGHTIATTVDLSVSFAVITLLFAMIFKFLPDVKIPWNKVWVGSLTTSILFTFGKYLLGLYLGRESTASAYGAAGSVIVLLMWVYYASLILLFGAEITQVYTQKSRVKLKPTEYAIPAAEEKPPTKAIRN